MSRDQFSEEDCWLPDVQAVDHWLKAGDGPLSLDTEFERVSTFYPIPGLVQLGRGQDLRLVEPSVAENSVELRALLQDPEQPKLLYSMSEDLELLRHWLELEPRGFLDLQIGAALAGLGFSVGYARMIEARFGIELDKSATRSDWLARPLSDDQIHYALLDVKYLFPLYQQLQERLAERGLVEAWQEESDRFREDLKHQADPERYYLRIRGGWYLDSHQQNVLKELVLWRERECRDRDRPRNRVLADRVLIAMAERLPDSAQSLASIDGVPPVVVRRYGETLLEIIRQSMNEPLVGEAIRGPLSRDEQDRFKRLKKLVRGFADASDIPIELLAPRKQLEACLHDYRNGERAALPAFLSQGWRGELLAPRKNDMKEILES